ncbi:hypothetical protein AC579_160 [Pseudocercospora musae]|uniref:Uncharacterized protein n=1 Tax=Pseudocercospora musae TaxID=113226 RepID=A0A139IAN3_9PEZI|nr:hypothetical protein AC579_160 [Pseudocercospora musae]
MKASPVVTRRGQKPWCASVTRFNGKFVPNEKGAAADFARTTAIPSWPVISPDDFKEAVKEYREQVDQRPYLASRHYLPEAIPVDLLMPLPHFRRKYELRALAHRIWLVYAPSVWWFELNLGFSRTRNDSDLARDSSRVIQSSFKIYRPSNTSDLWTLALAWFNSNVLLSGVRIKRWLPFHQFCCAPADIIEVDPVTGLRGQ